MRERKFFERKGMTLSAAAAIVLTVAGARGFAATFTVTNLNDTGAGSLRQAILDANGAPNTGNTPDEIHVQTGLAPGTINLLTPLPVIADAVRIINDGTGSGRIELNGLATRNQAQLSIGFDFALGIGKTSCAAASPACEIWGFAINRFGEAGIRIGLGGDSFIITQNYIGTDINGQTLTCTDGNNNAVPCGNFNQGVLVAGAQNVRVGTDATTPDAGCPAPAPCGHSNTIGGNFGKGVVVANGFDAGNNLVAGSALIRNNYIGITNGFPNNGAAMGNTGDGILIAGTSNNQIGGTTGNSANYIGSNGFNGIEVVPDTVNSPASNNTIQGNLIGQVPGSSTARGNAGSGIVIRGSNNTVGGTTAAARNVVVSNAVDGIAISGALATGNNVQGNYVGVASDGTTALGNQVGGIQVAQYASGNTIGGSGGTIGSCAGPCNRVANNGSANAQSARAGIYVDQTAGTGNTVRENAVFGNGNGSGIGIDVGTPGSTANDPGDADNVQNKPTVSSANTSGFITGNLSSSANTPFTIDFYANQNTDSGPMAQGRTWIGSAQVTTDGSGNVNFTYTTTATLALGSNVTATATRGSFTNKPTNAPAAPAIGSTSEFSAAAAVVSAPTAANVSIGGRVVSPSGTPIAGATITMTGQNGQTLMAKSNSFGYFTFAEVPSGGSYVVGTQRRGYVFDNFLLQVKDSLTGVMITAK